jgi:hypothetical protein
VGKIPTHKKQLGRVGIFLGSLITLAISAIVFFSYILPAQEKKLTFRYEPELSELRGRKDALSEELGIMHGILTGIFGKNTPVILEQYRRKAKERKAE